MSDGAPSAADFLLEGREPGNDLTFAAPPPRSDCRLEPLVDGVAAFQSMERAIAAATRFVGISFWVFNPATPVQADDVRRGGVRTWADLLRVVAERGVQVRILISDLDPLLTTPLHESNWGSYRTLLAQAARLGAGGRDHLQVVMSRHPATLTTGVGDRLRTNLTNLVAALSPRKGGVNFDRLRRLPGIWQWIRYDSRRKRLVVRDDAELFASPASHHQKTCVVDEIVAFCGGLDVNRGRIDTPRHRSKTTAWHDIQCRIEGRAVVDLARNFVGRWNAEAPRFVTFRDNANRAGLPVSLPVHTAAATLRMMESAAPKVPAKPGKSIVQVQRTMSEEDWTPVPETLVRDIAQAYERVINRAERFIYIENQYVRSPELKDWLLRRAGAVKELRVIIALPVAPEEVAGRGGADEVTLHGLHLQHELLTTLQREMGTRFGVFSMVKQERAVRAHATNAFNSAQIYLHSKCMIVDDVVALIGSANANPRSFFIDTELNVGWFDPNRVTAMRLQLWNELLGKPSGMAGWAPKDYVTNWTDIATANEKATPTKRNGFIVRHDPNRFPGVHSSLIPDAFANAFDPEAGTTEIGEPFELEQVPV